MGLITDIGNNLSNLWNNDVAKPVQQVAQNVGQDVTGALHNIGQGAINMELQNPVYGSFMQGIRSGASPILQNIPALHGLPQATQQLQQQQPGWNQAQPGVANSVARLVGQQVPYIPAALATDGLFNPLTSRLAGAVPEGATLGAKVLSGAAKGAIQAAPYGLMAGLPATQNGQQRADNIRNGVLQALAMGATGGALGATAMAGIGGIKNGMVNMLMQNHGMNQQTADQAVGQWARDTIGRFTGGGAKAAEQPVYYGDLNESLGLPRSSNFQEGKINFGAKVSNPFKPEQPNTGVQPESATGQSGTQPTAPQTGQQTPMNNQENSVVPSSSGSIPPGQQERKFITSVKGSDEVSPTVQGKVAGNYTVQPNKVLTDQSGNLINNQGLDKATNQVIGQLDQKGKGVIPDQTVSDAIAVAKAHDAAGNFDQATQVYDKLAEQLTKAGRTVQAASLLSSRTPQGLLFSAQKTLKGAGVPFEGLIKDKVQGLIDGVKQTAEGTPERQVATQELAQFVNSSLPRSKGDAALGIWRAGLLTGPETVAKVAVSHAVTTPFELASQIPAELHDRMLALVTGKRGVTATLQGGGSGLMSGIKAAGIKIKSGIDMPNTGGFEQKMGQGTHQTAYENTVQNIHGALPKPAFNARYNISLNDQALTAATNQGLKGDAKNAFVQDFVSKPSEQAIQLAKNDAEIATNQQKSTAGQLASEIQNFKPGGVPVGKIIAPFTRIPSAIGVNGLWNYTPFGYGSQVAKQIMSGNLDQRALSQAFGRSATGTSLAALGALLAYHGLMTLGAPADPKEKALWDTQGMQPNSIKVGNTWMSLNALGPVGIALGLGGGFGQGLQSNPNDMVGAAERALASGGKVLLSQPYLKGISGVANALNDPARYGQTLFSNTAGSVIPAMSSQIARGMDTVQRTYPSGILDKFKAEIPGLAQTLPATHNLFGQTMPGANPSGTIPGAAAGTVNPFYPQQGKSDPVSGELQRLYDTLGSSASPNIGQQAKNQTINGVKATLNPAQLQTLIAQGGPVIQQKLASLIQDPGYQALPDAEKANAINSVITATHKQVNGTINIGSPLTPNAKAKGPIISSGGIPAIGSTPGVSISSGTKQFTVINPDTGAVKTIDLSKPIPTPTSTGNPALDKKLTASYNTALTTRANDIVTLYKNGKIDAPTAEQYLEQLASNKVGTAKKAAKVTIKSAPLGKVAAFKSTPITLTTKTKKTFGSATTRIAKAPKMAKAIKISAKSSTSKAFKVTAPRVWLAKQGSSQRFIRKAAGIAIPVKQRQQRLTV